MKRMLSKTADPLGKRTSLDIYYETNGFSNIRIRQNGQRHTLTVKRRINANGIESNIEMEWGIRDIRKWRSLMGRLRLVPKAEKKKEGDFFRLKGFTVELNRVSGLGHYLEIEKLVCDKDAAAAQKELVALYADLGYSQDQFETKPYLELLGYV